MRFGNKQRLRVGDLVHIAKDLGPGMRHFRNGVDAIVTGSYADFYGGQNVDSYAVFIEHVGGVSWYADSHLTLLARNCNARLQKWRQAERDRG